MEFLRVLSTNFEDIRALFFGHMVQTSLIVFTGLALVGVRLNLWQVLAVGIPMAFYSYVERAMMLTYKYAIVGHFLLGIFGFILTIKLILRIPLVTAIVATIISYVIILASDVWFLMPIVNYFNLDLKEMQASPWLYCALGLLSSTPLLLLGGAAYLRRSSLLRLSGGEKGDLGKISDVRFKRTLN